MKNSIYQEKQSFITWWLVILMVILFIMQIRPIYENDWAFDQSTLISIAVFIIVALLLFCVRLSTQIDSTGITIQFFPFVRNKILKWEDIKDVYIKEYNILDYGGWGYRIGKNGVAYNTKGKYGLQIVLKNGARIMVGTQNPDDVKKIVEIFQNRI